MKIKSIFLIVLCLGLFGCSDSASDEFEEINGEVSEKLISKLTLASAEDPSEGVILNFSYDINKKLINISDGEGVAIFVYNNNGDLTNIAGGNEPLNVEEIVFNSPYNAFEEGNVLQYDNNLNPSIIEFYEYNDDEPTVTYTAEIDYDSAHNPYFHTMKAGGVISVLDDINLEFSINPQSPDLVQARALLPLKNPSQLTYKDENGNIIFYVDAN